MSSYNPNNTQGNYQNMNSSVENRGLFSRILRNLSSWGMNYDDMILRNQVGVGVNEDPYSQQGNSMYDFFSRRAVASVLNQTLYHILIDHILIKEGYCENILLKMR